MAILKTMLKQLSRSLKRRRAQKDGLPYEDEEEASLRLLYEKELPDGTRLDDATAEEIEFSKRDGLGGGIDWKNWRKYLTLKHWTLQKISELCLS